MTINDVQEVVGTLSIDNDSNLEAKEQMFNQFVISEENNSKNILKEVQQTNFGGSKHYSQTTHQSGHGPHTSFFENEN